MSQAGNQEIEIKAFYLKIERQTPEESVTRAKEKKSLGPGNERRGIGALVFPTRSYRTTGLFQF